MFSAIHLVLKNYCPKFLVGSTVGHLNLNDFKQLEIPVPPFPEEKAIAHRRQTH
ncbi:MAG: Type restriction modification specificity domain [Cyanobacteriota bacterium]|jgi:restriction endonuclease S subunit